MKQVLVLGTPRSGTSWLAKIFDSHPWVAFRNEPDEIFPNKELPYFCEASQFEKHSEAAARYLARLVDVRTTKTVGSLPIFRKAYRSAIAHALRLVYIAALRAPEMTSAGIKAVREVGIPDFADLSSDSILAVIKSVSLVDRAGLFTKAVPGLHTILIVRHPCASVASVIRGIRGDKFLNGGIGAEIAQTAIGKQLGLTQKKLAAMPGYELLTWHWLVRNEKAITDIAGCANAKIVTYHGMVAAAEETARELFTFVDLPWDAQTEEFVYKSQNSNSPYRYYSVYRNSGFHQMRESWSDVISPDEARRIRNIVRDSAAGQLFH